MKKLAVVLIGWHYPSQPYNNLVNQIVPDGWAIDYFVIAHRHPKYAVNEKKTNNLSELDNVLYRQDVTYEMLNSLGWVYHQSKSGNEWEGANVFLSNHDYNEYDCILFAGDDMLVLNDRLFSDIIESKIQLVTNENINGVWTPIRKECKFDDWLILSNTVHNGRQAIRGSFEFFKPEMIKLLGGKLPLHQDVLNLSIKLNSNKDTPKNSFNILSDYNKQFWLLMEIINKNRLYSKVKFMSEYYRVSDYIIEAERGLISNNKTPYANLVIQKINQLILEGKLENIL